MKILIDECIGRKTSTDFIHLLARAKPPVEAHHITEYRSSHGIKDHEWVPRIAEEKDWVVVTTDTGQSPSRGAPLQLLLPKFGITGFFYAGRMGQISGFEKIRSIMYLLPEIIEVAGSSSPGTRYKIHRHLHGFSMKEWPVLSFHQEKMDKIPANLFSNG